MFLCSGWQIRVTVTFFLLGYWIEGWKLKSRKEKWHKATNDSSWTRQGTMELHGQDPWQVVMNTQQFCKNELALENWDCNQLLIHFHTQLIDWLTKVCKPVWLFDRTLTFHLCGGFFVVSLSILDWIPFESLRSFGAAPCLRSWAFCDGLWIINLNMIDRGIELRVCLISGLVKSSPNDHWNLSVT